MALTKIEASNIAAGAVASSGFDSYQVKTSSTAWTKPTGITKIVVDFKLHVYKKLTKEVERIISN